jgi:hypothetical protein
LEIDDRRSKIEIDRSVNRESTTVRDLQSAICNSDESLSSRGPGRRPFKAVTRVRIPSGTPHFVPDTNPLVPLGTPHFVPAPFPRVIPRVCSSSSISAPVRSGSESAARPDARGPVAPARCAGCAGRPAIGPHVVAGLRAASRGLVPQAPVGRPDAIASCCEALRTALDDRGPRPISPMTSNSAADATRWVQYSHYSLLAPVEAIFNLGTLGRTDTSATPMSDLFRGGIP